MHLLKNTLYHLKFKWIRMFLLVLFVSGLELFTYIARVSITSTIAYYLITFISLFLTSVLFCGIYRIYIENRNVVSSLQVDRSIYLVMDGFLTIYILKYIVTTILREFGWLLLIPLSILFLFLPILSMKGYMNIRGIKKAFEIIKKDSRTLFVLFGIQIFVMVLSHFFAVQKFIALKILNLAVNLHDFSILTTNLYTILFSFLILTIEIILNIVVTTMTIEYCEYL